MPISLNDEKLTGLILPSFSNIVPEGFFLCDGSPKSRTDFSNLFAISPRTQASITVTTANVITWTSHGLATGHSIQFSTSGTLPSGIIASTVYYIRVLTADTFNLYTFLSQAMNTASTTGQITFTVSGSGTHTGLVYYWGNGNGINTFNIPDTRGIYLRGVGSPQNFLDSSSYTFLMGQKIDDGFQGHHHSASLTRNSVLSSDLPNFMLSGGSWVAVENLSIGVSVTNPTQGSNGSPRITNETRVKSIGVNYFIKY